MFRYQTSYRFYTLAKIGFGLAYLWYVWDFFWIHLAIWDQLHLLLPAASDAVFSGDPQLDVFFRWLAVLLNKKLMVWLFAVISPLVVGLFLWGRHKWLQFAMGGWMSLSIISLTALVGVFHSTADIWVNYVFVTYSLTALICPAAEWEQGECGFSLAKWRANPVLASTYAWFVVLVQFSVYFFAGVNKLVDGWTPWTTGVAIQNLAFDNSMHEFARGIHVPYWISLFFCYVTLLQRLVVPFGFYFRRWRIWSVLILGSMHIGYAILMYVNLFPLIGVASLLMIVPPRSAPSPRPAAQRPQKGKKVVQPGGQGNLIQKAVMCLFSLWLLVECTRLTTADAKPWEKKLVVVPAWRMFSDGGVVPAGEWRLVLNTPQGRVDATTIARQPLPQLWRDRFYLNIIYYDVLQGNTGPGSLVDRLVQATEQMYRDRQVQLNRSPVVLNANFEFYGGKPASPPH